MSTLVIKDNTFDQRITNKPTQIGGAEVADAVGVNRKNRKTTEKYEESIRVRYD